MNDENDHDQGTEHIEKGILDKLKPNDKIANAGSEVKTDKTDTDGEAEGAEKISPIKAIGDKVKSAVDTYKDNKEYKAYTERQQKIDPSQPPIPKNTKHNGEAMWKEENERLKAQANGPAEPLMVPQTDATKETEAKEEQGGYVPMGGDITPEQVAQFDGRQEKGENRYDPYGEEEEGTEKKVSGAQSAQASATSRQQAEWKPSVTSQRMMDAGVAGLNMFGNVLGGANKAFSMLRGLASALTSRQLMSDPTLPARGFLNAMDQSGQIIEDHIRQVGEAYGIKDGVKREDLVGTYKGAQYYREKQRIEDAEKQYYAGVGNALSTVLGNNVNVNDPVSIQNALAQMGPAQLSQLDDALFGQNGTLRDMYDATVTNPTGSTKEQKARAQLFTTLNQALKGQAQANAREAGRTRTQTNQQIQQANQQIRQIRMDQTQSIQDALQATGSPQTMPSSYDEQMATIIRAALGNDMDNKKVRMTRVGNTEVLDTNNLTKEQLGRLVNFLENSPLLGAPGMQAAQDLYNDASQRMFSIQNDRTEARKQFREQQRQSKLAPYMDSPLDYDILDRSGKDRDDHGIPTGAKDRERLYNNAWNTMQDLIATGGSQDDIDLCKNVMLTCDMSYRRSRAMDSIHKMETNRMITPEEAEYARRIVDDAYNEFADNLALTMSQREAFINSGTNWKPDAKTDLSRELMDISEDLLKTYKDRYAEEQRNLAQAQRDEELRDYVNSPLDMAIKSGKGNVQRDEYGIPKTRESRRSLFREAFSTHWRLTRDGGSQEDIDLCNNVMRMCNMANRRDKAFDNIKSMFDSGAITGLERDMYMNEIQSYYDIMAKDLAVTKDDRDARIANKESWTDTADAAFAESHFEGLEMMIEDVKDGHDREVRDRKREQERDRREAQRAAELAPYQNSILDLQIKNGRGNTKRDSYGIPTDRTSCRALRDDAYDRLNELVAEGASEEDVELCANVHTLCEAALKRDQIDSTIDRLERAGKITKEQAQIARQNAYNKYVALAKRLPVTLDARNDYINNKQAWKQDVDTDMAISDLEGTLDYLGFVESDYDEKTRQAKQERADRERQARARQREQERKTRAEDRARADQARKDEKDEKAKAEWEKHALRDDRGISLAPWNVDNNKYRKKDIADARAELAKIERDLANARFPDDVLELTKRKLDVETKIRRTCQEDHIQKLIAKAGQLDSATRAEVVQKAEALRDVTNDWEEFGRDIDDIYKEYHLGSDTAWASTRKKEEALKKQTREEGRKQQVDDILKAVQGLPDAFVRLLGKSFADSDGDLNKGLEKLLKANNLDLKQILLGTTDKRKTLHTVIRHAIGLKGQESLRSVLRDTFKENLTDVTDRLDSIESAVKGLNDADKSNIIQAVKDVRGATDRLTDFVTDVFTINGKTGQYANINDMKNELLWMSNKNRALLDAINQKIPLGGIHTQQQSTVLDPDTLQALQNHADALDNQSKRLDSLIAKLDTKGGVTKEDLKELVQAIKEPIDANDLEGSDGSNDIFGGGVWQSEDDYNEFMNAVRMINSVGGPLKEFMDGNVAQGLQPGLPVRSVDDMIESVVNRLFEEKIREDKEQEAARKDERGGAAFRETNRNDASETPIEGSGEPVEEQSVSEDGQVGPEVEEPPVNTETATDEGGGEIYQEGKHGEAILTPGERQELEKAETHETNSYELDNQGKLDFALDDWLNRLPHLKEYIRQHPEALRYLSMEGDDGKTVHQTLKDAIFRSFDQGLFEGQSASNIMAMMDEFLSQTSRDGLEQAVKEWKDLTDGQRLDPEKTRLQKGVIENIAGMAETALGDVFREDFIRRRGQPPADADIRTNGYAATGDLRRTMRVVAEAMAEEAELRRKGLSEDQIKARIEQEGKAQEKASEQKAEDIVKDLDPQIGSVLAKDIRDKLFYSSRAPAWSDYRSILDSFGELRKKYPGVVKDIDAARDDIVFGMIVPQLMGFKNIANVSPSDTLTKDKIEQISRRAMEIGLAKRQAVTDKNIANGGDIDKLNDDDRHWLGFPTVDELVNSHIYGRDNDKDPVDIHRAKVRRQEKGNMYNNRLAEAYKMAAREITLNDKVASELERIRQENPYAAFDNDLRNFETSTKLRPVDELWQGYREGKVTIDDVNQALAGYRTATSGASDLKKKIDDALKDSPIPSKVSNDYGEMDIPQDVIRQMNDARSAHGKDANDLLGRYLAGGDVSKQVLSLEALKEQLYEDRIKKETELDDKGAKKLIDQAQKRAGESKNYDSHLEDLIKKTKEAEEKRHDRSAAASLTLDGLKKTIDPYNRIRSEKDARNAIRNYLTSVRDAPQKLNQLAYKLGLKKRNENWVADEKSIKAVTDAIIQGLENENLRYNGAWDFNNLPPEIKEETPKTETSAGSQQQTQQQTRAKPPVEKRENLIEGKGPEAFGDQMTRWFKESDVRDALNEVPDNVTQENWMTKGLMKVLEKSIDPVKTLRNWAESLGMDSDYMVYHPDNPSSVKEIVKRFTALKDGTATMEPEATETGRTVDKPLDMDMDWDRDVTDLI